MSAECPTMIRPAAICFAIVSTQVVAHCQEKERNPTENQRMGVEDADALQGIWYTGGTVSTYGRHRPDKTYPPDKYARVYPGKDTVYSGPMATYCAWHRPMAVYVPSEHKTFFVFGNAHNSPSVSCYDHHRQVTAAPVVLGENPDGDAHRNPTLLIDDRGFIYVFYGAHNRSTKVVRSALPYEISGWVTVADIQDRNTYPQPWQLRSEELFVSYRGSNGWYCRRSTDGALSWEAPVPLIRFRDTAIYAVSIAETGSFPRKLHVAWSKMGGGTPEEVRTKALWARRYNVYYAYSDDGGTTWKKRNGRTYSLPITEDQAELIHDSGRHGVWLKDIQLSPAGRPYILFLDSDKATYETTWIVATYSADGWRKSDVVTSDHMYDAGGLVILAEDDLRLYAPTTASQDHEDGGEIEEWTSMDEGKTWKNTRHVTSGSAFSHNHVKVVHNGGQGDFRVMWSYGDSHHPPATRDVYLYSYGEDSPSPRRMFFQR
jgi:hypothetical protein